MTLRDWLHGWLNWRRVKRTAPLIEARNRRAAEIQTSRLHHRRVTDLYEAQRRDTTKLLQIEVGR